MIHFACEHCGKSVRVDDRFGGKTGRCPHCKLTVAIPAASQAKDALSALAAAVGTKTLEDTNITYIPPPPGVEETPPQGRDELALLDGQDADLADTVILPAGTFIEKPEEPPPPRALHPGHRLDRHRPALNAVRTILIVVAILVVLIVAVLGFALASKLL